MSIRTSFCLSFVALTVAFAPHFALAGNYASVNTLNEDIVKDFVNETTQMSSGAVDGMGLDEIRTYLDDHIYQNARFKSSMKFVIPGYPPQENTLSLDKDDYIKSIEQGADKISSYQADVEITSVKLSRDKRTATVVTVAKESGMMDIPADDGNESVPVAGTSRCNQIIILSKNNVIQMHSAQCTTTVTFSP